MLGLITHRFFLQQFCPGLVLRTSVDVVVIVIQLIFLHFLLFLQFVVELYVVAKLMFVVFKQRVFQNSRKRHSFLTIHHEYLLEKVIQLHRHVFQLIFFCHRRVDRK